MTLKEYREYIQEKIRKMFPFLSEYSLLLSVNFSDLALVEMKSDPDCEKMILESMRYEVLREKNNAGAQLEFSIQRARERRKERKDQMMKILLRKKNGRCTGRHTRNSWRPASDMQDRVRRQNFLPSARWEEEISFFKIILK